MVRYVHRQATNILQELCAESYGRASEKKLERFVDAIAGMLKAPEKSLVSDVNMGKLGSFSFLLTEPNKRYEFSHGSHAKVHSLQRFPASNEFGS